MLLSDIQILQHIDWGSIVIDPIRPERLNTDSYDLELGPYFWRYERKLVRRPHECPRGSGFVLEDARKAGGIWLQPNERVLGHSVEVAGGRVGMKPNPQYIEPLSDIAKMAGYEGMDKNIPVAVTTHLQATSTAARHGITACMCAGWGDVGFWNIWVFEIENRTQDRLWLPVGALIAQIAFQQVAVPERSYTEITGQYQPLGAKDVADVRDAWTPESMLPGPLKVREGWKEYF